MDLNGPSSRFRHRKSSSTDRFLGVSPLENPSSVTSSAGDEFNEDEVFWTGDFAESSHQNSSSTASSASSTPRHNSLLHHPKVFAQPESFGILAALPEGEASPSIRKNSLFYHKASISSSPASSSRLIPVIPKPPQERIALPSSVMYHQSAPVNVPVMAKMRRRLRDFDEVVVEDDEEADGEMLPPHEIVARSCAKSPMLSCSVLEGVGRTLKGRDLRQICGFWLSKYPCRRLMQLKRGTQYLGFDKKKKDIYKRIVRKPEHQEIPEKKLHINLHKTGVKHHHQKGNKVIN